MPTLSDRTYLKALDEANDKAKREVEFVTEMHDVPLGQCDSGVTWAVNIGLRDWVDYGTTYGLDICFSDGKRYGVFLPKDGDKAAIARRLRLLANEIDS